MQGRRDTTTVTTCTRWMAALGFSLGCHAALLGLLPMFGRATLLLPEQPIAVSLLGDAAGGSGGAEASGIADGDRSASGAAQLSSAAPPPAVQEHPVAAVRPDTPVVKAPAPVVPRAHARASAPPRVAATAPSREAARRRVAPADGPPDAPALADDPGTDQLAAPGASAATSGEVASAAGRAESESGTGAGAATDGSGNGGRGTGRGAGSGGGNGNSNGSDLRASCASCPIPEYPARARRRGWQGTVDVDLRVGRDGAVEEASVGRSSGFAALDAAAVTVARRSRFRVAAGTAINGQLRYRFVLEASDRPL